MYKGVNTDSYVERMDASSIRSQGVPERLTRGILTARMLSTGREYYRVSPLLPINVDWEEDSRVCKATKVNTLSPNSESRFWELSAHYSLLLSVIASSLDSASLAHSSSDMDLVLLPSPYDMRAAVSELFTLLNTEMFTERWDRGMSAREQVFTLSSFRRGLMSEIPLGDTDHYLLAADPPSIALATVTGIRTRWCHWLALHEAMGLRPFAPFLLDYFMYHGLDSGDTLKNVGITTLLESLMGRGQQNPTDVFNKIRVSEFLAYTMLAIPVFDFVTRNGVTRDTIFGSISYDLNTSSDLRGAVANFETAVEATRDGGLWLGGAEGAGQKLFALPLASGEGEGGVVSLVERNTQLRKGAVPAHAFVPQLLPLNEGENGMLETVDIVLDALTGINGDVPKDASRALRVARVTYAAFGSYQVHSSKLFASEARSPQVFRRWKGDLQIPPLEYEHAVGLFMGYDSIYSGNEYPVNLKNDATLIKIYSDSSLIGTDVLSVSRGKSPLGFKVEGLNVTKETQQLSDNLTSILGRTKELFPNEFAWSGVSEFQSVTQEEE
jgi:hypothetical protein